MALLFMGFRTILEPCPGGPATDELGSVTFEFSSLWLGEPRVSASGFVIKHRQWLKNPLPHGRGSLGGQPENLVVAEH